MTAPTLEQRAEWRRLAEAASLPESVTSLDDEVAFTAAARTAVPALLDEVERLEAIRVAAQDVLDFDGGNRSKCYHAAKAFDARERLFALLAALNPEGPSHDH